jgi:hypothetical protein
MKGESWRRKQRHGVATKQLTERQNMNKYVKIVLWTLAIAAIASVTVSNALAGCAGAGC